MGALIGFAWAQALRRSGQRPAHFFAAGYFAPHAPSPFVTREDLHAAGLSAAVRRMIDAPEAVLNNSEFMEALLPIIQADSRLVGSYRHTDAPQDCPITALGGLRDEEVSQHDLAEWQSHTTADFRLEMLPGKHLFLLSDLEVLLAVIRRDLQVALEAEAAEVAT
jgi:medium-chain acyl-[acyl-carrier-protein] hydrolase